MATIISNGTKIDVRNVSVAATGLTAISVDRAVNYVVIQCRTAVDMLFFAGATEDQTNYFTIKSGSRLEISITGKEPGGHIGWLQSGTGTVVAEVIAIY